MKLFPEYYDPPKKSYSHGESIFFDRLQKCDMEGTAFNSLYLREHPKTKISESDFVLVTENGVLVIEVKGGGVVRNNNGTFTYRNRNGHSKVDRRGPFKQAEQAMWAIKDYLDSKDKELLKGVLIDWAVSFPETSFELTSPEWQDWQIYDTRYSLDDTGGKTNAWLKKIFKEMHLKWPGKRKLSKSDIEKIAQELRPRFATFPNLSLLGSSINQEMKMMTEVQLQIAENDAYLDRALITGGAGTGKTVIASHLGRKWANGGEKVLILTPSAALANHIAVAQKNEKVAFHKDLSEWLHIKTPEDLTNDQSYDYLLVDEAQDLMDEGLFQIIDKNLKGGSEKGKWRIFLDKNNQADIVGKFDNGTFKKFEEFSSRPTIHLTTNCRNTKEIVRQIQMLAQADIGIPTVTKGHNPEIHYSTNKEDSAKRLERIIKQLLVSNVQASDITVLTSLAEDLTSSPWLVSKDIRSKFTRFKSDFPLQPNRRTIQVATPMEFKGLETNYAIYTDVPPDFFDNPKSKSEFYVALTRAKFQFFAILPDSSKNTVLQLLREFQKEP